MTHEKRRDAVEQLAQQIYDLRDSWPAADLYAWAELDGAALRLSRLVERLSARPARTKRKGEKSP